MALSVPDSSLLHMQCSSVKNPFDSVFTPLALSIDRQEGTLFLVGYRFGSDPLGPSGPHAGLEEVVPQTQTSFGRN